MNWILFGIIVSIVALDLAYKAGFRRGVRSVRRQQDWQRRTYRRVT